MNLIGNRKYEIDCQTDCKAYAYKFDLSHTTETGLAADESDPDSYL